MVVDLLVDEHYGQNGSTQEHDPFGVFAEEFSRINHAQGDALRLAERFLGDHGDFQR